MRCGVLCDKDGLVKRTWALISDTAIVPVEDGDQVMEWDMDHGEELPHTQEKLDKIKAAVKEQDRIVALKTHDDVLAHGEKRGHSMSTQGVAIAAPSSEPIHYSADKGLHHRTVDAEGDVQESAVHPSNVLQTVVDANKERG